MSRKYYVIVEAIVEADSKEEAEAKRLDRIKQDDYDKTLTLSQEEVRMLSAFVDRLEWFNGDVIKMAVDGEND